MNRSPKRFDEDQKNDLLNDDQIDFDSANFLFEFSQNIDTNSNKFNYDDFRINKSNQISTQSKLTLLHLDNNYSSLNISCPNMDNSVATTSEDENSNSISSISILRKKGNTIITTLPRNRSEINASIEKKITEESNNDEFLSDKNELWEKYEGDTISNNKSLFNNENHLSILNILKIQKFQS